MIKSYSDASVAAPSGATDAQVDCDTALADPAAYYADPQSILADDSLSYDQKRRFLEEWKADIVDRQVADQEGMGRGDGRAEAAEAELGTRLDDALARLAEQPAHSTGDGRSFWARLLQGG